VEDKRQTSRNQEANAIVQVRGEDDSNPVEKMEVERV
jgi:hypothetical protein